MREMHAARPSGFYTQVKRVGKAKPSDVLLASATLLQSRAPVAPKTLPFPSFLGRREASQGRKDARSRGLGGVLDKTDVPMTKHIR